MFSVHPVNLFCLKLQTFHSFHHLVYTWFIWSKFKSQFWMKMYVWSWIIKKVKIQNFKLNYSRTCSRLLSCDQIKICKSNLKFDFSTNKVNMNTPKTPRNWIFISKWHLNRVDTNCVDLPHSIPDQRLDISLLHSFFGTFKLIWPLLFVGKRSKSWACHVQVLVDV